MKCPHCDKAIVVINAVSASVYAGAVKYPGTVYICPLCQAVLSCQIDPLIIQADTAAGIKKEIESLRSSIVSDIHAYLSYELQQLKSRS